MTFYISVTLLIPRSWEEIKLVLPKENYAVNVITKGAEKTSPKMCAAA